MKKQNNLSVPEAAKRLNCTTKYIYDLLYSGSIQAKKSDGRWKIPADGIEERLAKRGSK